MEAGTVSKWAKEEEEKACRDGNLGDVPQPSSLRQPHKGNHWPCEEVYLSNQDIGGLGPRGKFTEEPLIGMVLWYEVEEGVGSSRRWEGSSRGWEGWEGSSRGWKRWEWQEVGGEGVAGGGRGGRGAGGGVSSEAVRHMHLCTDAEAKVVR